MQKMILQERLQRPVAARAALRGRRFRLRAIVFGMGLLLSGFGDGATAEARPDKRNADGLQQALIRAELALASKSADAASLFEHASHVAGESATAEIGMVRAYMASGQYRRALAFAHLVAGEHKTSAEALAWTALLNDRSGQTAFALSTLDSARKTQPDDVALLCAQSEILIDRQQATRAAAELDAWLARNSPQAPVLALRHRTAVAMQDAVSQNIWARLVQPVTRTALLKLATRDAETRGTWIAPHFDPLPTTRKTTTGLSIDDGQHIITLLSALPKSAAEIFVRDAQGHVRRALVERTLEDVDIALLKLDHPLPLPVTGDAALVLADRVFPGSPFHAVGFAVPNSSYPSFPTNASGFFARASNASAQQLSSNNHPAGAPVFNASGQLAGFATAEAHTGSMLLAAPLLRRLGIKLASAAATTRLSNEDIYEHALNRVVLVATTELAQ